MSVTVRLDPKANNGQESLFDTWRFHAFITTTGPDLKNSAPAHLASGRYTANTTLLVLAAIAFQPHVSKRHNRRLLDVAQEFQHTSDVEAATSGGDQVPGAGD